jgi:hypothetical protein
MPIPRMRFRYWNYLLIRCYFTFVEIAARIFTGLNAESKL